MIKDISVIIPTYQHADTIRACLNSLFSQTRNPKEIIVVNDGSTDGTSEVLAAFSDRVKVITQRNMGSNQARNAGFQASTSPLVIFCDADVIMRPEMLDKMANALDNNPAASFAYSGFKFGWKQFKSFPFSTKRLQEMNFIHTTSLMRREHFPGFDPRIKRFQDWDVWLTMLDEGHVGTFINEQLFKVLTDQHRISISKWRPSFLYRIPWRRFGWKPESIKGYDNAKEIVIKKHRLMQIGEIEERSMQA